MLLFLHFNFNTHKKSIFLWTYNMVRFNKLFDKKIFFYIPGLGTGLGFLGFFGSRDRFSGPFPGLGLGTRVSGFFSPGTSLVNRQINNLSLSLRILNLDLFPDSRATIADRKNGRRRDSVASSPLHQHRRRHCLASRASSSGSDCTFRGGKLGALKVSILVSSKKKSFAWNWHFFKGSAQKLPTNQHYEDDDHNAEAGLRTANKLFRHSETRSQGELHTDRTNVSDCICTLYYIILRYIYYIPILSILSI